MKSVRNGEEEEIHPDFILNVLPAGKTKVTTFIIETMGYESEEYLERKRQMHSWMEQEGVLLTDPPDGRDLLKRPSTAIFLNIYLGQEKRASKVKPWNCIEWRHKRLS